MTEITNNSEEELRNIFISVAYQKDLNLINSTIFMLFLSFLGFSGMSIYEFWNDIAPEYDIEMIGFNFLAILSFSIGKVFYLTFNSTAKSAQKIDGKTITFFEKITAF